MPTVELPRTPVDEFSGIPLPLHPSYLAERPSRFGPDMHHAWHDRLNPSLQGAGGLALRGSRVQLTNYDAHHLDYHRNFSRPELPETDGDRFRPIVLAAAGYIPDRAISFSALGMPKTVRLCAYQREAMWQKNFLRVENETAVREFLHGFVVSQDLSHLAPTVEEFLYTANPQRRYALGNVLLKAALRQAAGPVAAVYREAYSTMRIHPGRARTAPRFLINALNIREKREQVHNALRVRLAA